MGRQDLGLHDNYTGGSFGPDESIQIPTRSHLWDLDRSGLLDQEV